MKNIIGREKEIEELNRLYNSTIPQFVAVYGRRRVGKTNTEKNIQLCSKDRFERFYRRPLVG